MALFSKSAGKKIIELKKRLHKIEQQRLKYINQLKEISAQLYVGPHIHSYHDIINRMNRLSAHMNALIQKMGSDKLNNIIHYGKDLLELGGVNPALYKEYLKEREEYLNLKKQKKLIETKMELQRNKAMISINHVLNRIGDEEEQVLNELKKLKLRMKR